MRYKSISESTCREHVKKRLAGHHTSLQGVAQGTGERCVDYPKIRSAAECMERQIKEAGPKDCDRQKCDRTEGLLAVRLFQVLADVDPAVLDDDGFWRYIALRHFWNVVVWRQPKAFAGPESSEKAIQYVDAKKPTESVLTRMYLRAVAVGMNGAARNDESVSEDAYALEKAADFWRSHVIRVRTGTAPSLVRAFVRRQQGKHMSTAPLREFAKAVNRTWTNVLLSEYDEEEAAELLDELARDLQASSSGPDEESPEREQP